MLLTDKYADKIYGIIACYDRMIIQGYIPNWSHAEAMTTYMKLNDIRIFDYPAFSQPLTEQIRQNAEKIARENGIEIEFIRKLHAFRKDDRIQEIISEKGASEGLVHIFSAMECCNTYKPWHDKTTGKAFLKFDQSKCLHYYFYFIDKELRLCYLRVPTWPPFRLQFYMDGHNLLAHKLDKKQIAYRMQDNAFLEISDIETAQKLSDRINPEGLHKIPAIFARRYSPVPESLGLSYTWTVQQIECAADISRKKLDDISHSQKEKDRSYRGFNFFDSCGLSVLEAISRGEYMTFGMQGKNIRRHLPEITPSAMARIFKRLKVHGLIEKIPGSYKYLITALGKEIIAAGLTVKNLVLAPALTS